jgi:rhodanese-related sulfurtransferase
VSVSSTALRTRGPDAFLPLHQRPLRTYSLQEATRRVQGKSNAPAQETVCVNLAGMLAENVLNGDMPVADWLELDRTDALLLDVREPDEFAGGHVPTAINLPLSQMRDRYAELPTNRDIWTYCGVGQRAYFAGRFLAQHGYRSRNRSGGYTTYQAFSAVGRTL